MHTLRHILVALALAVLCGCGGGGGDSSTSSVPYTDNGSLSETSPVPETEVLWGPTALRVLDADADIVTDFTGCITGDEVDQHVVSGGFLIASGGDPDPGYRWSLAGGSSFPEGTTVDRDTGLFHKIDGATLVPGAYSFTMRASDGWRSDEGTYSLVVEDNTQEGSCDPGTFSYEGDATLPSARPHEPYAISLGFTVTTGSVGSGGPQAPFRFRIASGWLPRGLYLDSRTGVLSGRVRAREEGDFFQFAVRVTDATGTEASGSPPTLTLWVW